MKQLGATYFKALRRYSLTDITAGADAWIESGDRFPKPSDWKKAIPTRAQIDLRVMRDSEAREYRRAEARQWEDDPCACGPCVSAGVQHRPLRYVPDRDEETWRDFKAHDPIGNRVVTAGRWVHGADLARWYASREQFWSRYRALLQSHGMPKVDIRAVTREPGSDD